VWVSTDDQEIADLCRYHGADIMFRRYQDDDETGGWVPIWEWHQRMMDAGELQSEDRQINRLCTTPHLLPHDLDGFLDQFDRGEKMYGFQDVTVGAELRTHVITRKIVPNVSIGIPDASTHNDYGIVTHLAFLGGGYVRDQHPNPKGPDRPQGDPKPVVDKIHYYKVHPWQMQDLDTEEEWEFGELVMEHYILKGRSWEEVYGGV
jgi:hypothetical protein